MNKSFFSIILRFLLLLIVLGISLIIGQKIVFDAINKELLAVPIFDTIGKQRALSEQIGRIGNALQLAKSEAEVEKLTEEFANTLDIWSGNQKMITQEHRVDGYIVEFSSDTIILLTYSNEYFQNISGAAQSVVTALKKDPTPAVVSSQVESFDLINDQINNFVNSIDQVLYQLRREAISQTEANQYGQFLLVTTVFVLLILWVVFIIKPLIDNLNDTLNSLQAELTLKKYVGSETDSFKLAVNNVGSMIVITDLEGMILYTNQATVKITGYKLYELLGKKAGNKDNWGGQMDLSLYEKMWKTIKTEKKDFYTEINNKRKNGEQYVSSLKISPIINKQNELIGFISIEDDITLKVRAEEQLKLNEEKFRNLIEESNEVTSMIGIDGRILYESASVEKVLGYKPEELVGTNSFRLLHPADVLSSLKDFAMLAFKSEYKVFRTIRFRRKDGKWVWLEVVGKNLLKKPGINAIVVNFRDVTQRIANEKKLKEQAANLAEEKLKAETLLANISDPVVAVNNDGMAIVWNNALLQAFSLTGDTLIGRPFVDVLPFKDELGNEIPADQRPILLAKTLKKPVTRQVSFSSPDKKQTWYYELKANPILINGQDYSVICIYHDITREKQIEKAKTEFVTLASHQLRTPLSIISWYLEIINAEELNKLSDKQKGYIREISNSNERMKVLVNSLLNLSRLEMGRFLIFPQPTKIKEIAHHVVEELNKSFALKQHRVYEHYAENLPIINIDTIITHILLENIFSNAYKYSPNQSEINIYVDLAQKGEKYGDEIVLKDTILIKVVDKGYGIPLEQQNKVFTKFVRIANVSSKDMEGTGLGLYMVQKICDEVDCQVWFNSEEGKGTTFYLTLPLEGMKAKTGKKLGLL